jgi:hypothetical protein
VNAGSAPVVEPVVDSAEFVLEEAPPAERNPSELYLRRVAPAYRDALRELLDRTAAHMTAGRSAAGTFAWHRLRVEHVTAMHAALTAQYPPAMVNMMLSALRGVLKECSRIGLMAPDHYRLTSESILPRRGKILLHRTPQRQRLLSVLQVSAGEGSPAPQHNGAVRILLHGNGPRQEAPAREAPAAERLPQAVTAEPRIVTEQLYRPRVGMRDAIAHALWEADACIRQRAFCACLAMLRRALELWSGGYRDKYGMIFNAEAGERDDLYWRLTKIADENRLLRATIQDIVRCLDDAVRDDAPSTRVCRAGHLSDGESPAAVRQRASYRRLHEQVVTLITTASPELLL